MSLTIEKIKALGKAKNDENLELLLEYFKLPLIREQELRL